MEKKPKGNATSLINEIKRRTHRKFSSEEKIRIVVEGMRGEEPSWRKSVTCAYYIVALWAVHLGNC